MTRVVRMYDNASMLTSEAVIYYNSILTCACIYTNIAFFNGIVDGYIYGYVVDGDSAAKHSTATGTRGTELPSVPAALWHNILQWALC